MMQELITNTGKWTLILNSLFEKHGEFIEKKLEEERNLCGDSLDIFPPKNEIFNAFQKCCLENLKVIIIGQDPYINKGEAHGLAFSVPVGCKRPPSLMNIFKELERSYGSMRKDTDLSDWAIQGVLLLNTALTVREGCSASHAKIWKSFTEDLIKILGKHTNLVFMLWGNHAQSYKDFIDSDNNLVLQHTHPSPLSRKPFTGNNHFILCNDYLRRKNKEEIKWI